MSYYNVHFKSVLEQAHKWHHFLLIAKQLSVNDIFVGYKA